MKDLLIVYGDCQGRCLALAARELAWVTWGFEVLHVNAPAAWNRVSFEDYARITWQRCTVLWRQAGVSELPTAITDLLPTTCLTVTFPAIFFNAPWPLMQRDPLLASYPGYFYGKFIYSDNALMQLAKTDLTGSALVSAYTEAMRRRIPRALITMRHVSERLAEGDSDCDVKVRDFIVENYQSLDLFSAPAHFRPPVARHVLGQLLRATWQRDDDVADVLSTDDPLRMYDFPIASPIAAALGLQWWSDKLIYTIKDSAEGRRCFTLDEYVCAYVDARRHAGRTGAEASV
jgi:Polysaccharide biosynthesis enzyme WcbI